MSLSNINPVKRLEYFLQDIADGNTTATKTPVRRIEEFLSRIRAKQAAQDAAIAAGGLKPAYADTHGTSYNSSGTVSALSLPLSRIPESVVEAFKTGYNAASEGPERNKYLEDHLRIYVNGARAFPNVVDYIINNVTMLTFEVRVPVIGIINDEPDSFVLRYLFTLRPEATSGNFVNSEPSPFKYANNPVTGLITDSSRLLVTYQIFL